MKPNQKKQTPLQRPLRPKLPLRNRSKEPMKAQLMQPPPTPPSIKLSKEFIVKHSMFWKQQINNFSQIRSLILSDMNLNSFQSDGEFNLLELCNIQLLSLSKNNIISLHPLAELDSLIELNLNNNQVFDISPLSFLSKLESVYLNNNKINNIEPLYELWNLKNLHIYNNLIPYRQKALVQQFATRLTEIDIEKNEVYKEDEKNQWLFGKLRKFNGEPVSVKMKNQIQMGSTAQSFRPFSSTVMSRPSTARPSTASGMAENNKLQSKVQELEHVYLKLDNEYEDEIVNNVRLKQQLAAKERRKKLQSQNTQNRQELILKVQSLKKQLSSLKPTLINSTNPQLKQLFQLTVKFEKYKLKLSNQRQQQTIVQYSKAKHKPTVQKVQDKPFHADEEVVFDSDEDGSVRKRKFSNSDDELEYILRKNQEDLNQLQAELNSLK